MKLRICDQVMAVDYMINIPVQKGHCQTKMTCALKNMKGCIGPYYRGKCVADNGIGIGSCTKGFHHNIQGCPPKAKDILEYLEKNK
jgi:hypothetical protein